MSKHSKGVGRKAFFGGICAAVLAGAMAGAVVTRAVTAHDLEQRLQALVNENKALRETRGGISEQSVISFFARQTGQAYHDDALAGDVVVIVTYSVFNSGGVLKPEFVLKAAGSVEHFNIVPPDDIYFKLRTFKNSGDGVAYSDYALGQITNMPRFPEGTSYRTEYPASFDALLDYGIEGLNKFKYPYVSQNVYEMLFEHARMCQKEVVNAFAWESGGESYISYAVFDAGLCRRVYNVVPLIVDASLFGAGRRGSL